MGSAIGAMGWAMGGVSGMRTLGVVQTAYEGAMGALDVATNFIPGGKAFKSVKNIVKMGGGGLKGKSNGANGGGNDMGVSN